MTSAKGLNEDILTSSVAGDEYLCIAIACVRSIIRGGRRGGAHAMLVRREDNAVTAAGRTPGRWQSASLARRGVLGRRFSIRPWTNFAKRWGGETVRTHTVGKSHGCVGDRIFCFLPRCRWRSISLAGSSRHSKTRNEFLAIKGPILWIRKSQGSRGSNLVSRKDVNVA